MERSIASVSVARVRSSTIRLESRGPLDAPPPPATARRWIFGFLGIEPNKRRNAKNAPLSSGDAGRVKVRVIRTDEDVMIARSVTRVLKLGSIRKTY
jgi:hypothetical protein